MPILAPSYCLETSIASYLTSCKTNTASMLYTGSYTCFTGVSNQDLNTAPIIVVSADQANEIIPFSRVYEFNVTVFVKEMAADTTSLGTLAENVFNEFVDTDRAKANFTNPAYNISICQVQTLDMKHATNEDTLINEITLRMIGALIPSA